MPRAAWPARRDRAPRRDDRRAPCRPSVPYRFPRAGTAVASARQTMMLRRSPSVAPPRPGSEAARLAAERHARKVERVAAFLRGHPGGRPLSRRKKAVSHQVPKPRDRKYDDDKLDLTDLDEILAVDVEARTCTAEPGVTFTDLVDATL